MTAPWEDPRVREGLTRQLSLRRRMLDEGARHLGWKVGFGAPAAMEKMGTTAPLVGFLTSAGVVESGATVGVDDWTGGVVEFEVAVYMGTDVGPGASLDEARAAVAAVGPAIELADIDLPLEPERVGDIVAGDIFHRAVVLGEPDPGRAGLDVAELVARVMVDGGEYARTADLQALTGRYDQVVKTVAETLASVGERLKAGDVIITGSVVPPVPIGSGHEFTFLLEPFPAISIRTGPPTARV